MKDIQIRNSKNKIFRERFQAFCRQFDYFAYCSIIYSAKAFHTGLHDLAERIAALRDTVNIFIIRDFADHIRFVLAVLNNRKCDVRF